MKFKLLLPATIVAILLFSYKNLFAQTVYTPCCFGECEIPGSLSEVSFKTFYVIESDTTHFSCQLRKEALKGVRPENLRLHIEEGRVVAIKEILFGTFEKEIWIKNKE